MFSNVTTKPFLESLFASKAGGGGLLGPAAKPGAATGLLGGAYPASSADLMQQYLAGLHRRRYNPPAIAQQPGMVGSQMGPWGMQYMAPQVPSSTLPAKSNPLAALLGGQSQEQENTALLNWLQQQYNFAMSGGGGG